jgi:hypothetical protein
MQSDQIGPKVDAYKKYLLAVNQPSLSAVTTPTYFELA